MNGIGAGIDAIPNGMSSKFPLHGALTNGTITLIRRLLAARDLTTFTIIADFYTVELILYRNMCSHFETGFAPNPNPPTHPPNPTKERGRGCQGFSKRIS